MRKLPPTLSPPQSSDELAIRRCQVESFLIIQRLQRAVQERTMVHFKALAIDDITPSQANVLMVLFQRRRPMSAREIHHELGVSAVTMSRLVRSLVRNGWLQKSRDPEDGRAALLLPTPKARSRLTDFIQVANSLLDETFEGIAHQQLSGLHETIQRIDLNLKPSDDQPIADKT